MQYIKELPNGERVRVTQAQYDADRLGHDRNNLVYLVRGDKVCIYHMNGTRYRTKCMESPRYGGRGRGASRGNLVWNGA